MEQAPAIPLPRDLATVSQGPAGARLAVSLLFLANGALMGTWVSRIPAVQEQLGLRHSALGVALFALASGAMISMPAAGRLSGRFGSGRVSLCAITLYALMLPAIAVMPDAFRLACVLFLFGAGHGALDVSMNAQAVAVERAMGRPVMSSFHALFSLGGLAGSAAGGVAAAAGTPPAIHFPIAAAFLLLPALAGAAGRMCDDRTSRDPADIRNRSRLPRIPRVLLAAGVIAFCSMAGEGAMADWSAVFLREVASASEGMAAAGYAAFSVAMAGVRFAGDRLTRRFPSAAIVQVSGLLTVAGLAIVLPGADPALCVAGFALTGAGYALVVPLVFSAAGRIPGMAAGSALACVTTIGYLGFLAGPPLIGFVADAAGLRAGLGLLLAAGAAIFVLSPSVRAARHPRQTG